MAGDELLRRLDRQQENQQLGIPIEIAKTFSPRLRKLTSGCSGTSTDARRSTCSTARRLVGE